MDGENCWWLGGVMLVGTLLSVKGWCAGAATMVVLCRVVRECEG